MRLSTSLEYPDRVLDIENGDINSDTHISPYLDKCSHSLFVLEHNHQICGYVAAVPNNKIFMEHTTMICHSSVEGSSEKLRRAGCSFSKVTDWNLENKAHLLIHIDQKTRTAKVLKRVLSMALSVLKSLGSSSVLLEINDEDELDLYSKLGFHQVDTDVNRKIVVKTL